MYGSRTFKQTTLSRFDTRRREELHGEQFYEHAVEKCREEDILERLRNDFNTQVGMRPSPLGTFSQVTSYNRLQVPDDIIKEYLSDDGRTVDWLGFIDHLQTDVNISFDLDEVLGKFNEYESLHEIFDNEYEVDLNTFQTVCMRADVNLKADEIARIFAKYSRNMRLDYDKLADIFDEKKRDPKFQAKY